MSDYAHVKCLNPKRIRNPYTNEYIIASCGRCEACMMRKCDINTLKCKIESLSHDYIMFIGLSYADEFIPRCRMVKCGEAVYDAYDVTSRLEKYHDYKRNIGFATWTDEELKSMQDKVKNKYLPYLYKKDLQLFLKRFRKRLSRFTNEKIRYYAVGEYGPVHFRPHFHILLWFSSREAHEVCREVVRKSWPYGRISCEDSLGACAQYTASYVNGFGNLPSFYRTNGLQPFCCHSSHLGEAVLKEKCKEVYQLSYEDFIKRSLSINGRVTDVHLWRSLKDWYFPKCRNYAFESKRGRLFAYQCYATAFEWTGEASPYRQARAITQYVYEEDFEHFVPEYDRLLKFFSTNQRFSTKKVCRCDKDMFDQFFRSVYHDLRVSQHFLQTVCDTSYIVHTENGDVLRHRTFPTQKEINYKYSLIEKHYIEDDYRNLKNQMSDQVNFFASEELDIDEIVDYQNVYSSVFYANESDCVFDLKKTKAFNYYTEFIHNRARDSIKHKALNDLNECFNYI